MSRCARFQGVVDSVGCMYVCMYVKIVLPFSIGQGENTTMLIDDVLTVERDVCLLKSVN